jgi:hypothetical protein
MVRLGQAGHGVLAEPAACDQGGRLGIQVWRSPPFGLDVRASTDERAGWSLFHQGAYLAADIIGIRI